MLKSKPAKPTKILQKVTKSQTTCWEEAVAERLKKFADRPENYFLEEFYLNEDMDDATFYEGVHRNEVLKKAHKYAMTRLGLNRERLALKNREGTNSTNSAMLYHYLNRWADHKKHSEDREDKKEGQGGGTKIVVIEKFKEESSDEA